MTKDLIICGGSPFLNTVDLPRIDTERFDVLAINRQPFNIRTKDLLAHDQDFRSCHSQEEVKQVNEQGLNPVFIAPKTEFIHETTGWKWKPDIISHEDKLLGFCMYSCSSALNFAYLKGYKNVYFVGVDLAEDNKPFSHWHGVTNHNIVSSSSARHVKEYLYKYKKWLNIYQTNPSVKDQWQCDYCPIDRLYSHQ
jgi:hypothetical protein